MKTLTTFLIVAFFIFPMSFISADTAQSSSRDVKESSQDESSQSDTLIFSHSNRQTGPEYFKGLKCQKVLTILGAVALGIIAEEFIGRSDVAVLGGQHGSIVSALTKTRNNDYLFVTDSSVDHSASIQILRNLIQTKRWGQFKYTVTESAAARDLDPGFFNSSDLAREMKQLESQPPYSSAVNLLSDLRDQLKTTKFRWGPMTVYDGRSYKTRNEIYLPVSLINSIERNGEWTSSNLNLPLSTLIDQLEFRQVSSVFIGEFLTDLYSSVMKNESDPKIAEAMKKSILEMGPNPHRESDEFPESLAPAGSSFVGDFIYFLAANPETLSIEHPELKTNLSYRYDLEQETWLKSVLFDIADLTPDSNNLRFTQLEAARLFATAHLKTSLPHLLQLRATFKTHPLPKHPGFQQDLNQMAIDDVSADIRTLKLFLRSQQRVLCAEAK